MKNNVKLVADKLNDFCNFDSLTSNDGVYELTGFGRKNHCTRVRLRYPG